MNLEISVCLCTYRRNAQLKLLLDDLARQTLLPVEVIVVDNDASGSARAVIEGRNDPYVLRYDVQPVKNISLTRNRSIAMASGEWLAIIDDDERAPADWLQGMAATLQGAAADGVLGHVDCVVPESAPAWLRRGGFYDSHQNRHGAIVPLNRLSKGNALLRGAAVRALQGPYNPALGLSGGEDVELYVRLVRNGARIVWCDRPRLSEPVEASRLSMDWLIRRAYRGGQSFARHQRQGDFGPVSRWSLIGSLLEFVLKLITGVVLGLLLWPLGRQHAVGWWLKAAANWGKLTAWWGWSYQEYA